MRDLPHLAGRVLGTPLMIEQVKMDTIMSVIGPRLDLLQTGIPLPPLTTQSEGNSKTILPNGIAVIPIRGTLVKRVGGLEAASGMMSYAMLEEMLLDAVTSPDVTAILLDIDSPGGEVGGVFDLASMIYESRQIKPIWSLADSACSAAYLLAAATQKIYLTQTSCVGSIGVLALHVDESEKDAKEGRKYTTVFAGTNKVAMSNHAPLAEDAKAQIQNEVDRLYGMFVDAVSIYRGMSTSAVKATEANLFFGDNAIAVGLANKIGTFRDTVSDLSVLISTNRTNQLTRELSRMDSPEVTAVAHATPTTELISAEDIRAGIVSQLQQDAGVIVDLCTLANMPQMAGGFIAKGMTSVQVRQELLSIRATSSQEIFTAVMPGDGTNAKPDLNLEANPVVIACQKMAQSGGRK